MSRGLLVTYKNNFSQFSLSRMNQGELNVFVALLATIKNKGTAPISMDFAKFRKLAKVDKNYSDDEIHPLIMGTLSKVSGTSVVVENETQSIIFPMFEKIIVDKKDKVITLQVSDNFTVYFNNFIGEFTSFPLLTFTTISGKYAKILYKTLMQFSSTGVFKCDYDKFIYEVLGVPESTKRNNINYKILKPAMQKVIEGDPHFKGLDMSFVKKANKTSTIIFTFKPFKSNGKDEDGEVSDVVWEELLKPKNQDLNELDLPDDDLPF